MDISPTIPYNNQIDEIYRALPFLNQLDQCLLQIIDTTEISIPKGDIENLREQLEEYLYCHIVTYRIEPPSTKSKTIKLCQLLKPAYLSPAQMIILNQIENIASKSSVVFVAYKKPIQLRFDNLSELESNNSNTFYFFPDKIVLNVVISTDQVFYEFQSMDEKSSRR